MPRMLTGGELADAVRDQTFIENGAMDCAEGVKYDFRLGPRVLKAKFNMPVDVDHITDAERREMRVEPGEVVFVLTQERLRLPTDMTVQLSPKRKLSHAGILTLGGFCIDPGYEGRLLIGLFNLSSTPFPIIRGKKLIGATFFRLEGQEIGTFPKPGPPMDEFPDELVQVMQKYQPVTTQALAETVVGLQDQLQALQTDIRAHESWYSRFKESLEAHNTQIGALSSDLAKESEVRKRGEDQLTEAVTSIRSSLSFLKGAAWFVSVAFGIGITFLIAWVVYRLGWNG